MNSDGRRGRLSRLVRFVSRNDRVRDRLLACERALLEPSTRSSRRRLEAILDGAFTEIGASGRVYSRAATLAQLEASAGGTAADGAPATTGSIEDFRVVWRRGPSVLVSYRYIHPVPGDEPRFSLRTSLWVRRAGTWRIVHHQGTPVSR